MKILLTENLENLLQKHWTDFINYNQLMKIVLERVRDSQFQELKQQNFIPKPFQIGVTKIIAKDNLELWVEFSIPKSNGVVIGTALLDLKLNGDFDLKECFGTYFRP